MESARKKLGKRIKTARRAAGYKSARTFAIEIGVSEGSVARAETGDPKIGPGVLGDIETGLGWPEGSIERFLENGDESHLPSRADSRRNVGYQAQDDFEREVLDSPLSRDEKKFWIERHRAAQEAERQLLQQLTGNRPDDAAGGNDASTDR